MGTEKERNERLGQIEAMLLRYLPVEEGYQKTVCEAMHYSIAAGGKRLRPMLMLETYRLFGGTSAIIEPFAAAIEMIHTYSLVHDDLPAMDDDEYRRGKKTTHAVYGEAIGILTGDALLNYAYETAARAFSMEPGNETIGRAFQMLSQKAGIYGMVGGQTADLEAEGETERSEEKLYFIYQMKTGALLEASMAIGALLAGAGEEEVRTVERAAGEIGLAFQIQDDVLDLTGSFAVLGKPIGSDQKNQKMTYVTLYGLDAAKQKAEELFLSAMQRLDALSVQNPFLTGLLRDLIHREK